MGMINLKNIRNMIILSVAILLLSLIFTGCTTTSTQSYQTDTPVSQVEVKPQKASSFVYASLIDEIQQTDKYINKFVNVTGKMEFQNNPSFDGYVVDEKGYKLLFKLVQKRGFNSEKMYTFHGDIITANSTKYLQVTRGVYEVT